jgi:hypothetical protein
MLASSLFAVGVPKKGKKIQWFFYGYILEMAFTLNKF